MSDATNEENQAETFVCDGCGETFPVDEMIEAAYGAYEFCDMCYMTYRQDQEEQTT